MPSLMFCLQQQGLAVPDRRAIRGLVLNQTRVAQQNQHRSIDGLAIQKLRRANSILAVGVELF